MAKQRLKGKVIRNKMDKTVIVQVERKTAHPKYKKTIIKRKKYYVHSENELEVGRRVTIEVSKPISKLKRWKIVPSVDSGKRTVSKNQPKSPSPKASEDRVAQTIKSPKK